MDSLSKQSEKSTFRSLSSVLISDSRIPETSSTAEASGEESSTVEEKDNAVVVPDLASIGCLENERGPEADTRCVVGRIHPSTTTVATKQEKTVAVATIFFLAHPVVKDDDEQGISDEFDRLQVQ